MEEPAKRGSGGEIRLAADLLEAAVIEKKYAGAEGDDHDPDAAADSHSGDDAGAAFGSAAHDEVGGDSDEQFENAAGQEIAMKSESNMFRRCGARDQPENDCP